jgi:hypothetical protein
MSYLNGTSFKEMNQRLFHKSYLSIHGLYISNHNPIIIYYEEKLYKIHVRKGMSYISQLMVLEDAKCVGFQPTLWYLSHA